MMLRTRPLGASPVFALGAWVERPPTSAETVLADQSKLSPAWRAAGAFIEKV